MRKDLNSCLESLVNVFIISQALIWSVISMFGFEDELFEFVKTAEKKVGNIGINEKHFVVFISTFLWLLFFAGCVLLFWLLSLGGILLAFTAFILMVAWTIYFGIKLIRGNNAKIHFDE